MNFAYLHIFDSMILVTGSLAFDHIMNYPGKLGDHIMPEKIHMLNASFLVDDMKKSFGGTAGNIAYSLSLLGIRTTLLGIAGEDFQTYRDFLEKNDVDISYIKLVNNLYTSTAFGITDASDNQIWGFYTGADKLTDHLSIFDIKGKIDFGVIAPHNPRAMIKFAKEYQQAKIPYLFDPGMQLPWLTGTQLQEAFKGATIIIGNDYEMSVIEKKIERKIDSYAKEDKIIITTLGPQGSSINLKDKELHIGAARARDKADPAGAGDAYRAGFVAGYLRGLPIQTCGQMGSLTAAYTVEKFGTTTHSFTMEEFTKRYKDNFGEELRL